MREASDPRQGNPESGQTLAQEEQSATQSATTPPGSKQNNEKTAVVADAEAGAHSATDTGE